MKPATPMAESVLAAPVNACGLDAEPDELDEPLAPYAAPDADAAPAVVPLLAPVAPVVIDPEVTALKLAHVKRVVLAE